MGSLILEAQIDKAANQPEAASKRFRDYAGRPDLTTAGRWRLADTAETPRPDRRGRVDLPPRGRRAAPRPPGPAQQVRLAVFLARHGTLKEAIDLCEGLWADPALRENRWPPSASRCSATPPPPSTRRRPDASSAGSSRAAARIRGSMSYLRRAGQPLRAAGRLRQGRGRVPHGDQDQRSRRDRLQQPRLADRAARAATGSEALDLINNAIRAKGPLAGIPRHPGHDLPDHRRRPQRHRRPRGGLPGRPHGPQVFPPGPGLSQGSTRRRRPASVLEAGKTRGLPGGLHRLEVDEYNQVAGELGMKLIASPLRRGGPCRRAPGAGGDQGSAAICLR